MLVNAVTASLIGSPSTEIPLPQCFDVLIKHCRSRLVVKRSRALSPLPFLSDRVHCVVTAGGMAHAWHCFEHQKMRRKVVAVTQSPFNTPVVGSVTDCKVPLCPSSSLQVFITSFFHFFVFVPLVVCL